MGAVFGLREVALNSRTLFLAQIQNFFERIWFALRDRDIRVRMAAGEVKKNTIIMCVCVHVFMMCACMYDYYIAIAF